MCYLHTVVFVRSLEMVRTPIFVVCLVLGYPLVGSDLLEGDIILSSRQNKKLGQTQSLAWPQGQVHYSLDGGGFSRLQAAFLSRTLSKLEAVSCVRFLQRSKGQRAYIRFNNARNRCASSIGYRADRIVEVYLGWPECMKTGTMQHEILHALGMWHEHTRADRDSHVTVLWNNIAKGKEFNFLMTPRDQTISLPYDYTSVLHYRAEAFSKTGNEITLQPKDRSAVKVIGQRKGVSLADIAKLNRLYECPSPYYRGDDIEGAAHIKEVTTSQQLRAITHKLSMEGSEVMKTANSNSDLTASATDKTQPKCLDCNIYSKPYSR